MPAPTAFPTAPAQPGVRVIALAGEGRAFAAGGNLRAFFGGMEPAEATAHAMIGPLHRAIELLAQGDVRAHRRQR